MPSRIKSKNVLERYLHKCTLDMENQRIWQIEQKGDNFIKVNGIKSYKDKVRITTKYYNNFLAGKFIILIIDITDKTYTFKVANLEGRFGDFVTFKIYGEIDKISFTYKNTMFVYKKEYTLTQDSTNIQNI